jgi:hypothetical protein
VVHCLHLVVIFFVLTTQSHCKLPQLHRPRGLLSYSCLSSFFFAGSPPVSNGSTLLDLMFSPPLQLLIKQNVLFFTKSIRASSPYLVRFIRHPAPLWAVIALPPRPQICSTPPAPPSPSVVCKPKNLSVPNTNSLKSPTLTRWRNPILWEIEERDQLLPCWERR